MTSRSILQINGEDVNRGDIIVLMALPQVREINNRLAYPNTFAIVVGVEGGYGGVNNVRELPWEVLNALMPQDERHAMAMAMEGFSSAMVGQPPGIAAMIWKRDAYRPTAPLFNVVDLMGAIEKSFTTDVRDVRSWMNLDGRRFLDTGKLSDLLGINRVARKKD